MDDDRADGLAELLEEVRRIDIESRRLVTDALSGGYRSVFRGAGVEFDEVREYAEGDDPRTMDWGVTARIGRPFVRKYAEERELTLVFVLDLAPTMMAGAGAWSQRGAAARVAACLALAAARNSDRVGLVAAAAGGPRFVPPRKGARHAMAVVRDCLALPAEPAPGGLAAALAVAGDALRRRTVLFVLSDFLETGAWRLPLAACAARHDVVAVRISGPELDPTRESGMLRLREPGGRRSRVVDWRHAPARAEFRARVAAWRRGVDEDLRRARVDRVEVAVPVRRDPAALAKPLLAFFRMRETRGARR